MLWRVSNAVPGVAIAATEEALQSLAARPDVVKISALVPKKVTNANTAQLVKALNTWHDVGNTGAGVKVGVIDTGIDYTHADFGGPGTVAAWTAAHAHSAAKFTPTAKVVGGTDFVGDNYNADTTAADYQPVPHPGKNPLDCESHGTHVFRNGRRVRRRRQRQDVQGQLRGSDRSGSDGHEDRSRNGADGLAVRIEGVRLHRFDRCRHPALDWALDPNGDGDFSDHLDVVNMSLGSNYATPDDPENDVVDELSANGVLSVIAMGNNGDLTDTGGAPGNAISSLAVASTVDSFQLRDGLRVEAPADLKGIVAGQFSVAYAWKTKPPVTGTVVTLSPDNADGCAKVSAADAFKIKGNVAWLIWDDNDATRRCGSVGRSGNVAAAGAIGAIFTSGRNVFCAGITGSAAIPVVQLPKVGTDKLAPAVAAGTSKVTFDGKLQATIKDITPSVSDTLSSFSSRGTHGAPGVVKPDVAAPGDTIASAGMGSGNGVLVISGTSMATPLTAGVAALVKKMHPTWTPEQLKAAVMNTATHDVYSGENKSGPKYGPARVGAGRIDALAAVSTKVLAYNVDQAGAVSASFGAVEAPITSPTVTRTQTIRIQNTATKPVTVQLAYEGIVSQPGVSYTVSPATLTVKASGSGNATVKMTINNAIAKDDRPHDGNQAHRSELR
ncbi:MAG: S8 family serine peptidase [Actinomycetota bacterium]|nr:S8 family serine peptidase [Actinomycetota bacterium]